jgi:hypothetical protein
VQCNAICFDYFLLDCNPYTIQQVIAVRFDNDLNSVGAAHGKKPSKRSLSPWMKMRLGIFKQQYRAWFCS